MSIIYSLISRSDINSEEDIVLVEYTQASGNFTLLTRTFMKKLK